MKNLLNTIKKYLVPFLLCIFLIFAAFKILSPFTAEWKKQSNTINDNAKQINEAKKLLNNRASLEKSFDQLSKKIQAKLPEARKESEFLTEIGNMANETSVHISTMNPLPFKDLGAFNELSVEIEMEANLGNLVRFLYNIRKSSVVLVANRLRLQPKSERSALLKGQLMISTIFLKDR